MLESDLDKSFLSQFCDKIFEYFESCKQLSFEMYLFMLLGDRKNFDETSFYQKPDWTGVEERFFESVYINVNDDNEKFDFYKSLFKKVEDTNAAMYSCVLNPMCENSSEAIGAYLDAYFELMCSLLETKLICQEAVAYKALRSQLLTGYVQNLENDNGLFYRFFSPIIIEKVVMIYDFTQHFITYYEKISENDKMIKEIFRHLYFEKLSRLFYMNVISEKKHYIYTCDNKQYPIICSREDLSSIMMVKPIRWLDKIRAYIEEYDSDSDKYKGETIRLLVIGYVKIEFKNKTEESSEELRILAQTLNQLYPETNFLFDILINKEDLYFKGMKSNVRFDWENVVFEIRKGDYYEEFLPLNIRKAIMKNDIVLFLDAPCLYEHEFMIEKDYSVNKNCCANVPYENVYAQLKKEDIILPTQSKTAPIHRLVSKLNIIGIDRKSQETNFHYALNDSFATFVQGVVDNQNKDITSKRKDVHILYSSTSSVANSLFALENIAREERYKGKAFRLISFISHAKQDPRKMLLKPSGKMIDENFMVFSLWNMVKNIDITMLENEKWRKNLGTDSVSACQKLMNVFVKFRWSSDFKQFNYEVKLDKSSQDLNLQFIVYVVEELLRAVLLYNGSSIGNCILNSFYNTIYSQIKTVDDAVFYCLFRTRNWKAIEPRVDYAGEFNDESKPVLSVNQPHRWTVVRAINELQKANISLDQYYSVVYELKRNNYDAPKLLYDIYNVCENNGYKDCRLYYNVLKLINN